LQRTYGQNEATALHPRPPEPDQKQDYPSPVPSPLRVLRISWDAETKLEHPEDHTTRGTQDKAALFSMQRTSWPSVSTTTTGHKPRSCQYRNRLLSSVRVNTYNSHLGLLRPERGTFCSAGFQPALDGPGNMTPSTRSRGYLPHLEGKHPIYFVTFRLADSLPRELVVRVRKQREALEKARAAGASVAADRVRLQELRALLQKVERCLDSGLGACYMRDFRIAKIVADAIRHFHGKRYQVLAWCVMPNHVHVVFSTLGERKLEAILHSWKSFSAQGANRLLGRSGGFWQREYFDHLVRNEASLSRIIRYVQENPQKAGLRDWPWAGTEELRSAGFQPAADSEKAVFL